MATGDIKMAEAILNRMGDPNGALERNPLVGASEKAILYARKGGEFTTLSKIAGASAAMRTVRDDWRRPGGPTIVERDPNQECDGGISRYLYEKVGRASATN